MVLHLLLWLYLCCVVIKNAMSHLQICIGALLVLLFCFKDLTALPQYQHLNANLAAHEPSSDHILEARSLNVSDSISKLHSNLEYNVQSGNDSALSFMWVLPVSVPSSNVNLTKLGSTQTIAARIGLEESPGNSSGVQQQNLYPTTSEPAEITSKIGNVSEAEAKSLGSDAEPAVSSSHNFAVFNAPPVSPFVPSFPKSFGLRRKRAQTAASLLQLPSDLSASLGSEQLLDAQQQIAEKLLVIANLDGALSNGNANS